MRHQHLNQLSSDTFDVLVVGGGINGAVSAAALSARGARVALIDARDFAGFTSQQSSNLIWGGIKYLESYEFSLVAKLCKARNRLIQSYPSEVREIRFLTTIPGSFRRHPRLVWAGAWLYWLMGRGFTQPPRYRSVADIKHEEPAINITHSRGGVEYSDAYLADNDARFVFNFIRTAIDNGCVAGNYVRAGQASWDKAGLWRVGVEDVLAGKKFSVSARAIINAGGPFVDTFNQHNEIETRYRHTLSKGIHLIVPRIARGKRVLAFFANDGRLFFAIPMGNRTCIGTTDTPVSDPITQVSEEDRDFVLNNINQLLDLKHPLTRADIIAERCGVRPLAIEKGASNETDFLQLSRKHQIEVSASRPYMSIFGGKLTDCLNVGEEVCEKLHTLGIAPSRAEHPQAGNWYGEPDPAEYARYRQQARALSLHTIQLPEADDSLMDRLWRRYGIDAFAILALIKQDPSRVMPVIEGLPLYRCELPQLANREMVTSLEDLLHRRTKLGLLVPREKLRSSAGIMELCQEVFAQNAEEKFAEYFGAEYSE